MDAIGSPEDRLRLCKETGNADYLVDVANFAMIEFMRPAHPNAHDAPSDGGEGRAWHGGRAGEREAKQRSEAMNNQEGNPGGSINGESGGGSNDSS